MSKIIALKNCFNLSNKGSGIKSKIILFFIGILNQSDPKKKASIIKFINKFLKKKSKDGIIQICLKSPFRSSVNQIKISIRYGDQADYQSIFECLGSNMYPKPNSQIKFVFDGGANIGFFSIASAYIRGVKEIILVEPNPKNKDLLLKNLDNLKNCINLKVYDFALYSKESSSFLELSSSNTGHLEGSPGHEKFHEKVEVSTKTIGSLIPESWDMNLTWIKLDIEGAEYEVLMDLLENDFKPKVISLEIHDYLNSGGERLVESLMSNGYKVDISGSGESGNVCRQVTAELN